jgi:hypothetical protein
MAIWQGLAICEAANSGNGPHSCRWYDNVATTKIGPFLPLTPHVIRPAGSREFHGGSAGRAELKLLGAQMILEAISNLLIIAFSILVMMAFLSDSVQPQASAILARLNWPLKRNYELFRGILALEVGRRSGSQRYLRFVPAQLALMAAVYFASDFWWAPAALLSVALSLAVITGWSENEEARMAILRGADRRQADDLSDLRDEALVAGLFLFFLVSVVSLRLSPALPAFDGPTDSGPVPWIFYVLQQCVSAITLGIPDALGWKGLSGIDLSDTDQNALGEHVWAFTVRTMMSTLLVGTAAKMLQIRQTIQTTVKTFDSQPEPMVRLGSRAKRSLEYHLSLGEPAPNHIRPTEHELENDVVQLLIREAETYDFPRSTRAINALRRLRAQSALPIIQRKMCKYFDYFGREKSSDFERLIPREVFERDVASKKGKALVREALPPDGKRMRMQLARERGELGPDKLISRDHVVADIQATVECFGVLLEDYVAKTGAPPPDKDGSWYTIPRDVFQTPQMGSVAFPALEIRRSVARLTGKLSALEQKWHYNFLEWFSLALQCEEDLEVVASILDGLRLAGAPTIATTTGPMGIPKRAIERRLSAVSTLETNRLS